MSDPIEYDNGIFFNPQDQIIERDFAHEPVESKANQEITPDAGQEKPSQEVAAQASSNRATTQRRERWSAQILLDGFVHNFSHRPIPDELPLSEYLARELVAADNQDLFNVIHECAKEICNSALILILARENVDQATALWRKWNSSVDRHSTENDQLVAHVLKDELIEMFREALWDMGAVFADCDQTRMVTLVDLEGASM